MKLHTYKTHLFYLRTYFRESNFGVSIDTGDFILLI